MRINVKKTNELIFELNELKDKYFDALLVEPEFVLTDFAVESAIADDSEVIDS